MVLSKLLKYSAFGVGLIVFGECYYEFIKIMRDRLQMFDDVDDINEAFVTQGEIDDRSIIVRQIKFRREPTLRITEILENLILSSRKTVYVAMYIFTSNILAEALKSVHENGVKVFVVLDSSMEDSSKCQIQNLKKSGIPVRICPSSFTLHHKFCLIDVPYNNSAFFLTDEILQRNKSNNNKGSKLAKPCQVNVPKNGLLINGSLNWTQAALTMNYENFTVTSNEKLTSRYFDEFVERWKTSEKLL